MNSIDESDPINADLLTSGMRLTYVDYDDERHTITVASVNKDPEFSVLSDRMTSWEVTDRDGDVWTVFVALDFDDDSKSTLDTVSPMHSSARYDVVNLQPIEPSTATGRDDEFLRVLVKELQA